MPTSVENLPKLPKFYSRHHIFINGLYYNLDDESLTAEVTWKFNSYANNSYVNGIVTIPSTINYDSNTYKVVMIGEGAFQYCFRMSTINLTSTNLKIIGIYAFYYCRGLSSVSIPYNVYFIGDAAFARCSHVTRLTYGARECIYMGDPAYPVFRYCNMLTTVAINNKVRYLPDYGLYGCNGLVGKSFTIPSLVVNRKDNKFFPKTVLPN